MWFFLGRTGKASWAWCLFLVLPVLKIFNGRWLSHGADDRLCLTNHLCNAVLLEAAVVALVNMLSL